MNSRAINKGWRTIKTIVWALAAVVLTAMLGRSTFFHPRCRGPIAEFEPLVSDFVVYHLFTPPPPTGNVVIAAIDDRSIAQLGRFPWPRSIEASLVKALAADGAKVIAFDMFFSERDPADVERERITTRLHAAGVKEATVAATIGPAHDDEFAQALAAGGSVYIAYAFNAHLGSADRETDDATRYAVLTDPAPVAYTLVRKHPGTHPALTTATSYIAPLPALNRAARGVAYADIDEDEDGRARAYPAVVLFNGRHCAPLFLAAANAYMDHARLTLDLGPASNAAATVGDRVIPLDEMGKMMIHFRGSPGTIPHYSVADIINGAIASHALRDKVVIVGVTAHALGDRFVTPLGADFPGVEIQANAIDNVLSGDFIHQSVSEHGEERWAGWILGIVIGVAAAFLGAGQSLALLAVLATSYVGYALWRFQSNGAIVGLVFPLFALILTYLATISYRYMVEGKDKRRLRSVFEMYLHPDVLAAVVDDPDGLKLGGQREHLSVLFADIIGFTELAERLEPEPLVAMLNTYMSVMTDVILNSGGVVDKLMGDGIMAFWGPPLKMVNPARAAIDCALKMLAELKALGGRDERFKNLRIGLGIATGDAIVGNLGGEHHFDYSAVGDTVNLASRIEGLTRVFKVSLLMNRATLEEAGTGYISREVGLVRVKGREQLATVIEVVGHTGDAIDSSYYDRFARAIAALHNGGSVERGLRELLAERPDDTVVAMSLERLQAAVEGSDRAIVFEFDTK
jgi:adenylate cyclase